MNLIELFILTTFEFIMMVIVYTALVDSTNRSLKEKITFILFASTIITFGNYFVENEFLLRILNVIFVFIMFKVYSKKILNSFTSLLTSFIIMTIILFIIQIATIIVINLLFGKIEYIFKFGVLSQCFTMVLVLILIKSVPLDGFNNYINNKNIWVQIILINMYLIYFVISTVWHTNSEEFVQLILIVAISILILITINILVLKNGLVDKQNKERLYIYETYIPIINSIIDEVKIKQHDYHNQIQTLRELSSEYEDYLSEVSRPDIWNQLILLDNKVIMALFYSKYSFAKQKNIDIRFNLENYLIESKHTDFELVEMYGILIDNAVEASIEANENIIEIKITWNNNMNVFKITNQVINFQVSKLNQMFNCHTSTKGSDRGIGLFKLQRLLKSNNGKVIASYDSNTKQIEIEVAHI